MERLAREWSWLARATGPTRDLDVFVESLPRYGEALSREAQVDLRPFRRLVVAHREIELDELLAHLDSVRYGDLMSDWKDFVGSRAHRGPAARTSARRQVADWTWRRYRRARRSLGRLHANSYPDELHRARIDLKKLRYLVEFFRSLFDRGDVRRVLGPLKDAQDALGAINDLSVHRRLIRPLVRQTDGSPRLRPETLIALGELSATLGAERVAAIRELRAYARPVARSKARRRYKKLFRR